MKKILQKGKRMILFILCFITGASAFSQITTYPYFEDFESGDGGWVANNNGDPNGWQNGKPAGVVLNSAHSGANTWGTNLTGDYSNNSTYYLESPDFDFSGFQVDPYLTFNYSMKTEKNFDWIKVEYSIDNGITWNKLGVTADVFPLAYNWYNGNDVFTGNSNSWKMGMHRLSGLAGLSTVKFRFTFTSDGSVTDEGFIIDDIGISTDYAELTLSGDEELIIPESGSLTFNVESYSSEELNDVNVSITIYDGSAEIFSEVKTIASILPAEILQVVSGTISRSSNTYKAVIEILFNDYMTRDNGYVINLICPVKISSFPYSTGFEPGDNIWHYDHDPVKNSWELGMPSGAQINTVYSGQNAFVTNLDGVYNNNSIVALYSPEFDLTQITGNPVFSLAINYETEDTFDSTWVEYSTDFGNTWNLLGLNGQGTNWYNYPKSWQGSSAGWFRAQLPLNNLAAESSVIFRVLLQSDGSTQFDGMAIDDIFIGALSSGVDLAVTDIKAPGSYCDLLSPTEPVTIKIVNTGDQLVSSFATFYKIGLAFSPVENVNQTLAPGESFDYTFTQTANLNMSGSFEFTGYVVATPQDNFTSNDSYTKTVIINPIVFDPAVVTDVTCYGDSDGSIEITASGGFDPLEYSIDATNYQSSNIFSGLAAGGYNIAIKSGECQIGTPLILVSQPPAISFISPSQANASCFGATDGSIAAEATGGSGTLSYSIDNGATYQQDFNFANLAAGDYTVIAFDGTCQATQSFKITEPAELVLTNELLMNISCGGISDGQINILADGGADPANILYSLDGSAYAANTTFSSLAPGDHILSVKSGVCTLTKTYTIVDPTISNESVSTSDVSCNGANDGSITITATSADQLEYSIDNGATYSSTPTFTNLNPGDYQVSVKTSGCTSSLGIYTISEPPVLAITNEQVTGLTCNGNSNASISITAAGGPGPNIEYSIDGGVTYSASGDFTGLAPGTYSITIRSGSCTLIAGPYAITDPRISNVSVSVTNETCSGSGDGKIQISAASGLPLQYSIDNGATFQTASTFSNLIAGDYAVIVTNSQCQLAKGLTTVGGPDPIIISSVVSSPEVLCFGSNAGSITITATGPGTLYYSIDGGSTYVTENLFTGLSAGTYSPVVKSGSCTKSGATVKITEQPDVATPTLSLSNFNSLASSAQNNQWFLNGNLIDGITGSTYDAPEPGVYNVKAVEGNCFSASSNDTEVIITALTADLQKLELFPNPVADELVVSVKTGQQINEIYIRDLSGKLLRKISFPKENDNRIKVDFSDLTSGIYLLEVIDSQKGKFMVKVLKD